MCDSPLEVVKDFMIRRYYWPGISEPIEKWINSRKFTDDVILTFRDIAIHDDVRKLIIKDGELLIKNSRGYFRDAKFHENIVNKVIIAASTKFSSYYQIKCNEAKENLLSITRDFPYMVNRILNATPYATDNIGLSNYKWMGYCSGLVSIVYNNREVCVDNWGRVQEYVYECGYSHYRLAKIITEKYNLNNFQFSAKALKKYGDIALIAGN